MAKRKRFRPTTDRKPSTMATTTSSPFHQQRTRKGIGARGGAGEAGAAKNTNGIHKPRKMKTFARISSSSPSPFSGPWPSAQSNNNGHNNSNGKRTRLTDVSPTTASPARVTSTHIFNNRSHSKNGQHNRPIIPFGKRDRILLVGEGKLHRPLSPASISLYTYMHMYNVKIPFSRFRPPPEQHNIN
jgi:hypothetical protein